MHPPSQSSLLLLGIVIILITPGPTNTLLAAAGLRRGIKRAMPLMAAELAGYLIAISAWGYLVTHAANFLAWLPTSMRIACSVYIAYLAVAMWRAAVSLPTSAHKTAGVSALFVTTLLNPKAMLFASAIFPPSAFADPIAYLRTMSIFAAALIPIGFLWITFGAALGTGRLAWLSPERVQRGASIVLATFSVALAWTTIH
ncbi:LysE family protein [Caballeronia calidae]|uniref:LysE family protein n=1 Tax=Caballeronia calidae TaxID=1777139 RepID=A0A158D113_9BURK|nr:LysE family transporter [Caballeronia calidae]SAK88239.1 LysE family protein [Caballeronia calidae]